MNTETHDILQRVRQQHPNLFENPRFWLDLSDQRVDQALLAEVVALASGDRATVEQVLGSLVGRSAISLRGADVQGDLEFGHRHVPYQLDLRGMKVSGRLDLSGATFDEVVNLSGSVVAGALRLSGAQFHSSVVLNRIAVGRDVTAVGTSFRELSVIGADLRARLHFTECEVAGAADFADSRFHSGVSWRFGSEGGLIAA